VIETETENDVPRRVPKNVSRARLPSHNLLRMSVIGELFSFNNSPLVYEPKN